MSSTGEVVVYDEGPPNLHPAQLEFLRSRALPKGMHVFSTPKTSTSGVAWLRWLHEYARKPAPWPTNEQEPF